MVLTVSTIFPFLDKVVVEYHVEAPGGSVVDTSRDYNTSCVVRVDIRHRDAHDYILIVYSRLNIDTESLPKRRLSWKFDSGLPTYPYLIHVPLPYTTPKVLFVCKVSTLSTPVWVSCYTDLIVLTSPVSKNKSHEFDSFRVRLTLPTSGIVLTLPHIIVPHSNLLPTPSRSSVPGISGALSKRQHIGCVLSFDYLQSSFVTV